MIPVRKPYLPDRKTMYVNGEGETSRDVCFIKNVVQINILSATADTDAKNPVHNVALGDRTTLITLSGALKPFCQNPASSTTGRTVTATSAPETCTIPRRRSVRQDDCRWMSLHFVFTTALVKPSLGMNVR